MRFAEGHGHPLATLALVTALASPSLGHAQGVHWTTDAAAMEEAISRPVWRWLASQPCADIGWRPTSGDPSALVASRAVVRGYVRQLLAGVPAAHSAAAKERYGMYSDGRVRVELVSITSRLRGATVLGYLATPAQRVLRGLPTTIILPGAYARAAEAFGWRMEDTPAIAIDGTPLRNLASALVQRGFVVFVPILSDDYQFQHRLPWQELENFGATLAVHGGQGNALTFAITQIESVVDFVAGLTGSAVSVAGWEEGALLGALAAIIDSRIASVARMSAPRDGRTMRTTDFGVRSGAAFSHVDCAVSEVAQAAAMSPRRLLYAWADNDPLNARTQRFYSRDVADSVTRFASALGGDVSYARFPAVGAAMRDYVANWIAAGSGVAPSSRPTDSLPRPAGVRYPYAELQIAQNRLYAALDSMGRCRSIDPQIDLTDTRSFTRTAEPFRQTVARTLRVNLRSARGPARVIIREPVSARVPYTLEWIWIRSVDGSIELGGLLATPRVEPGAKRPAILSFDGSYGVSAVFGIPPAGRSEYLNAYGDYLARKGLVVFAPARPAWEAHALPAMLRARGANRSRPDWMLNYYALALDFLAAQPNVDGNDIITYGISEAAYGALYLAALDERVTGTVYSNPGVSHDSYFKRWSAGTAVWQYEFCSTADPVMRYLIAPRGFTWEGDNQDLSIYRVQPLDAASEIARTYRALGVPERFRFRRHLSGHQTIISELFKDLPLRAR